MYDVVSHTSMCSRCWLARSIIHDDDDDDEGLFKQEKIGCRCSPLNLQLHYTEQVVVLVVRWGSDGERGADGDPIDLKWQMYPRQDDERWRFSSLVQRMWERGDGGEKGGERRYNRQGKAKQGKPMCTRTKNRKSGNQLLEVHTHTRKPPLSSSSSSFFCLQHLSDGGKKIYRRRRH